MDLKHLEKLWRRFRAVILVTSTFVVATRAHCDSYGLRSAFDVDRGWQLYKFTGSDECLVCFCGMSGQSEAELVLPCWNRKQQRISRITVSYIFRRPGNAVNGRPLTFITSDTICEMEANYNQLPENTFTGPVDRDGTKIITINVEQDVYSYHLKASGINPSSFICLTNVEYKCDSDYCTSDYTPVCGSDGQTYENLCKLTNAACDKPNIEAVYDGECKAEQRQSNFPIWVIIVIIAIMIISIFAVVLGVLIRQRKQQNHQPANNVTTGREKGESNGINGNIKNDKDVIPNPTYGREPVNEKEEEYHSYTEIDVKVPGNSEMIYNSAYESPPESTDMVYNCAYESEETNSDMIYNTAYESSPSK